VAAVMSHTIDDRLRSGDGRCDVISVWILSATHDERRVVSLPHITMGNLLTVTEKEHWKNRIAERIEKRIDVLFAEEPGLLEPIREKARVRALDSLGIRELQERLDGIQKQEERLDARKENTRREMLARIRDVPVEQVVNCHYGAMNEVQSAIEKRQLVHEDELLAETDLGREVLSLRLERDNLLDTVWLATSPKQIKDLWKEVDDLLGGGQTQLQREALAIDPPTED
jgi:hypothetical protein